MLRPGTAETSFPQVLYFLFFLCFWKKSINAAPPPKKECHEKQLENALCFLSKLVLLSGQLWQYAKGSHIIKNMARGWLNYFQ